MKKRPSMKKSHRQPTRRRSGPVDYHYGSFPPGEIEWQRLIPLLGPAAAALARYDGLLSAVPNAHVLLSPMTTQEAVLSSRIEGTQATMGEVLEYEAGAARDPANAEKVADIHEIINYERIALVRAANPPGARYAAFRRNPRG